MLLLRKIAEKQLKRIAHKKGSPNIMQQICGLKKMGDAIKLCFVKCCVGDCRSNYDTEKETIKVHSFPSNAIEHERWVKALSNILPKTPNKNMVGWLLCNFIEITLRHGCSPVNLLYSFRTPFTKNTSGRLGHQVPVDPPSIFATPKSFVRGSLDAPPRDPERRDIDYESRTQ